MSEEGKKLPRKRPNKVNDAINGFGKAVVNVYQTYKAEFRKIVWPTRETLIKHTATVIVVSLIFGAYIAALDGGFGWLFGRFVSLVS